MADYTLSTALNEALRDALIEDERVLVFGEDVATLGGVFRVTAGLQKQFGEDRVFDTPLAEAGIVGIAVGLAIAGFKPVIEMQFDAFSYPALDQVISHVAKYRNRTRGVIGMPMVIRIPFAGGIGAAEQHSDSPETYYAHTAGLKVVVASTPIDAYSLLRQAVADPDPVVFFEPKSRYWAKESGELVADGVPMHRARILREGTDATLIAWGPSVNRCLEAAALAEEQGVSIEVLDVRSLVPLDLETLAVAVRTTGRAVVVHESPMTLGFGAEISARVTEDSFYHLEAPVLRVTGYDTPYPPARIEEHWLPNTDRILRAINKVLSY